MKESPTPQLKTVQIELSSRCNERCVHCYIPHENKTRDMDPALLFSLIEQYRNMGIEQIVFSGGEPMLHPDFIKADWEGLKLRIFSSLTLLDNGTLAALKAFHPHEVQTSLYSVDPVIHDEVTQKTGSCEATKRGIERLVKNDITAFISCSLMKQNKDSYPGVLAYANSLGIGCMPNMPIMARSDGDTENLANRLSIDEALEVIQSILENDTAYNAGRFLPGYHNPEDALPCVQEIGKYSVCVNAKGEVLSSPVWNRVLGDLNTQSLRDVWENSAELKKIRAISLDDFPQCRSCPDIYFCDMNLEDSANENPSGKPFIISDHVCALARQTRELVHGRLRKTVLTAK